MPTSPPKPPFEEEGKYRKTDRQLGSRPPGPAEGTPQFLLPKLAVCANNYISVQEKSSVQSLTGRRISESPQRQHGLSVCPLLPRMASAHTFSSSTRSKPRPRLGGQRLCSCCLPHRRGCPMGGPCCASSLCRMTP